MAEPMDLNARVQSMDEKLDRLSASVDARFTVVDERFQQVDQRFQQVDERFVGVLKLIATTAATSGVTSSKRATRRGRHFDVVAEQMKSERNLAIDKAIGHRRATRPADRD